MYCLYEPNELAEHKAMAVTIEQPGVDDHLAGIFAERMRSYVGVVSVELSNRGRPMAPLSGVLANAT